MMPILLFLSFCGSIFNVGNNRVDIDRDEYTAQIRFYSENGIILKELNIPDFYGYKIAPQGQYLYFINNDGINIYNGNGEREGLIRDNGTIAISSNDKYLACVSDNNIRLYQEGKKICAVDINSPAIRRVIFSSDNQFLGVMMRNHFSLVSLATRQITWTKDFSQALVFSKLENGKIIIVSESRPSLNGKIYILSFNGELVQIEEFQYEYYQEQIQDIEILPDGIKAKTHQREWVLDNTIKHEEIIQSQQLSEQPANAVSRVLVSGYDTIPWPLGPTDSLHSIGNSWGEFQNYGGSSYYHPGVDILSPEVPNVPVYAVKNGHIKAWLSTGDELYWRFAIADSSLSYTDSCNAYLYAHIDSALYHKDIGDTVQVGELIGYLVYWPVDSINFHHIHFAKIRDRGATWTTADWAFVFNPLISIQPNQDTIPPRFENAVSGQQFAFARNSASTYLSPTSLNGNIDIIAKIHDKFSVSTGDTIWDRLTPLKIEYEIIGQSASVPRKLSFIFNKVIPPTSTVNVVYKSDATCRTKGDYESRDYYFIVTNTDGDSIVETSDGSISWQTTSFPNGNYWVKVYASDVSNNVTGCSMQVTVANNPAVEEQGVVNDMQINIKNGLVFNALGQKLDSPNLNLLKQGIYFYHENNRIKKILVIKQNSYFVSR